MRLTLLDLNIWEIFGTLTGFVCVWLAAREKVLTWPLGIISALLYYKVFSDWKLYSDAWLQLLFAVFQVYGWYNWYHQGRSASKPISRLTAPQWGITLIILALLWMVWYYLLIRIKTDASLPVWDSFTTVASLLAVYLQARKVIDCWWIWIAADLVYIPMYLSKDLYFTTGLYILFLILAVYGYVGWQKNLGRAKLA